MRATHRGRRVIVERRPPEDSTWIVQTGTDVGPFDEWLLGEPMTSLMRLEHDSPRAVVRSVYDGVLEIRQFRPSLESRTARELIALVENPAALVARIGTMDTRHLQACRRLAIVGDSLQHAFGHSAIVRALRDYRTVLHGESYGLFRPIWFDDPFVAYCCHYIAGAGVSEAAFYDRCLPPNASLITRLPQAARGAKRPGPQCMVAGEIDLPGFVDAHAAVRAPATDPAGSFGEVECAAATALMMSERLSQLWGLMTAVVSAALWRLTTWSANWPRDSVAALERA